MKIPKNCQIEKCVSTEDTRYVLAHVFVDAGKKMAVATDGRRLVTVPVEIEEGDTTGYLSPNALKAARKLDKRSDKAKIGLNGGLALSDGSLLPRREYDESTGRYPNWEQVIPTAEATMVIAFNPRYLYELACAMGSPNAVTLRISDNLSTITAIPHNPSEALGVLMPIRPS